MSIIGRIQQLFENGTSRLERLTPMVDLLVRLWVANVFWKSGLTKITTWDSTLYLFEYEYAVPFLSPQFAAAIGTGIELVMPVLLVVGIAARLSASVLFVFNIAAVISYPAISIWYATDHQLWGLLLLITIFHGPGRISVDHFLKKHHSHE